MDIQDIIDLPVSSIADRNCYLFLWVTAPCMPEGIAVLKAWGFEFFTVVFTWIKMNKKNTKTLFWGMGKSSRANPEYVLLGRKGKLERKARNVHSVIMSPIEEHSKKPDEIRRRIELLYGGLPCVELFARQKTLDWDSIGFDIDGCDINESLDKLTKKDTIEVKDED